MAIGVALYSTSAHLIVRPFRRAKRAFEGKPLIYVMKIRTRKLLGTVALLLLAAVWSLMGMTVAQTPWLASSGLRQAIFYVVAGMGWVLPAMPIVSWMLRPDPT
jgi:hypothetical protein